MSHLEKLQEMRNFAGQAKTPGLSDSYLENFFKNDLKLGQAIDDAYQQHQNLRANYSDLLAMDEEQQIAKIQEQYINFYTDDTLNPYVSLAACGPWVITSCGAVIHDSGGYGMLGLGHAPKVVLEAMNKKHVMANIMTANFSQLTLVEKLNKEIGHSRAGAKRKPFSKYLCLNSGSEAVTVAARISDINAKNQTEAGGKHAGKKVKFLGFKGAFHGRTDRPAQVSDSTMSKYKASLASFNKLTNLVTITPNDIGELKAAFAQAETENVFFESFFIEPVMGEGNPGEAVTPEFYQAARELTAKNNTLFLVDSIQASLRAHGCLSICDYPGFAEMDPPDFETYSKALNAGQFPLSVLAMSESTAKLYVKGVYGNTMTTNPRGLDVACAVLDTVTPAFRENIEARGAEFVEKLKVLQKEFPKDITDVKGTGLLLASSMDPTRHKVVGFDCLEEKMRRHGIGVIHGGANALRFTPHFNITSDEIDLVINVLRDILKAS